MMDETKLEETTSQEPAAGAPEAVAEQNDQPVSDAVANGAGTNAETGAEEAAPDYLARIGDLESALAEERDRAAKLLDQSQRMAADFQNSRRRLEIQVQDEIERASTHLLRRLLPVIDDFNLAFAHVPAEIEASATWVEGFRQIQKKLHTVLADEGVEVIRGEGEFDPALHEAVSGEPSDDVPSGHIIGTLRAGYTYKGKVLRPALVRVAM